ncbi:MAG: M48 family metallopeptidase [bacterium]
MIRWFRIVRKRRKSRSKNIKGKKELILYKEKALELVIDRLEYFNQFYDLKYGSVKIKAQRTRWGSCSSKGNLNFSYKIFLLPHYLADYLVVHELCHIKEFNHSQRFWDQVAMTIPDFAQKRMELKKIRLD